MNRIKNSFDNLLFSYNIIFKASKKHFFNKIIVTLILTLLPFTTLYIWKEILNIIVSLASGNSANIFNKVVGLTVLYSISMLLEQTFSKLSDIVEYKYNDAIEYYIDNLMIDKVSNIDLGFFDSSELNDMLNNSWSMYDSIKSLAYQVFTLMQSVLKIIISFILLSSLNFWIAILVIILAIPAFFSKKNLQEQELKYKTESSNTFRRMSYYKSIFHHDNITDIKIYDLKDYFIDKYNNLWQTWFKGKKRIIIKSNLESMLFMLLLSLSEIAMFIVAISKLIARKINVGDVQYYLSLVSEMRNAVNSLIFDIVEFNRCSQGLYYVRKFMDLEPLLEKRGSKIPNELPEITFENVSFKYADNQEYILKNCSFTIKQGKKIGLVGLNGSGKSTIVKLLLRFYDPCHGRILINNVDAKEYDITKLRSLFGVLFQDYCHYSLTLKENIALSDINRINDINSIKDACDKSGVTSIIKHWEHGLDSELTRAFHEAGKELSGGQWQRISLARAFFRNSKIVILDEPSAALDPEAEHEIFEHFIRLSKGKSALLISHRLSNITIADEIIVLENGHIIEKGSHLELLDKHGRYAYLFNLQASKYTTAS